ncbi:MAG: hypothetical protein WC223_10575 [Bacteroidales bacterium]|jgi:hypothetical protein
MAIYTPQYSLFKIINKLSSVRQVVFWTILGLSIIPVAFKEYFDGSVLINIINILNIVGISMFFILEIISDFILIPQADNKRRDDFIDNSFGSIFSPSNSIGYYDNDEISKGLYKASVNLFENCFYTYSLVKVTTSKKIIIPSIMLLFMVAFSYYGFKEVPFALSVLQALFSANILGLLIKHLILLNSLSIIQDYWITLFQHEDLKENTFKYQPSIYRYWLQYETLHSKINAGIPEKVFKKLNPLLTEEWNKLKVKYNIS